MYPKMQNMSKNSTRSRNFELKVSNSAKNVGLLRNPIPYSILATDNTKKRPPPSISLKRTHPTESHTHHTMLGLNCELERFSSYGHTFSAGDVIFRKKIFHRLL